MTDWLVLGVTLGMIAIAILVLAVIVVVVVRACTRIIRESRGVRR